MIEVGIRYRGIPKVLTSIICNKCGNINIYYDSEIIDGKPYRCSKCCTLLPDFDKLISNLTSRLRYHRLGVKNFL